MGRHASAAQSRGLARWIVIASVLVVTAALITVGYFLALSRSGNGTEGLCTSAVSLPVAAGPDAATPLSRAAAAYNATGPVVRSTCVIATVTGVSDNDVIEGLTGRWRTKDGPAPGLWIADSAASLATLDAIDPGFGAGHALDPIAWSPVVLAVAEADQEALPDLSWRGVAPAIGIDLDGTSSSEQSQLSLHLPPVGPNRSVSYAVQSMLTVTDPSGAVTEADVAEQRTLVNAIGQASLPSDSVSAVFDQLTVTDTASAAATPSADASADRTIRAVPAIEATVVRAIQSGAAIAAIHPRGVTVGDALIPAPITAEWTNRTMIAAATDFASYLSSADGQQILADAGWRTVSAHPSSPEPSADTAIPVSLRPAGGPVVDAAIAAALGQPLITVPNTPLPTATEDVPSTTPATPPADTDAPESDDAADDTDQPETSDTDTTHEIPAVLPDEDGPVLTVIVDTSAGMGEEADEKTLLRWVQEALPEVFAAGVTDRIGLWVYADGEVYPPTGSPKIITTGPLANEIRIPQIVDPDADEDARIPRSQALVEAVAALTARGERWAYGAVMETLATIEDIAVDGRDSRVLLLTSGADDTPGTLRRMVLDDVEKVADVMRLDVFGLGASVPVDAYTDIAAAGGGDYIPVTDPSKLATTIIDLLSTVEG